MPCIVGDANMSKTKEIKSAMHMASSSQYMFAHKVGLFLNKSDMYLKFDFQASPEFILMMCSKIGLLISWDDNDSLKNEELVGVVHFDGALVGTKKDGVQEMVCCTPLLPTSDQVPNKDDFSLKS